MGKGGSKEDRGKKYDDEEKDNTKGGRSAGDKDTGLKITQKPQHDGGGFSDAIEGHNIPENKDQDEEKDENANEIEKMKPSKGEGGMPKQQTEAVPNADGIYENFRKIPRKKNGNDHMFILSCLKSHFVFYNHSEAELQNIVDKMFFCEIDKSEYLFNQGDSATCFFIIERGALEVLVNAKTKRELKSGDGFGELALLYNAPRSASIKAVEHTQMWTIDRNTYRKAVEEIITKEYEENRKFLDIVKFFDSMTIEQKDAIAGVLITQRYSKGQLIVSEGDPASSFYIIKEGAVTVLKGNTEVRKLHKGDSFGEQALYYNTVRQMSVKAVDDVKVLALGRDTVAKVLSEQIHVITFKNIQKWALEKNALLSKLTKSQIDKVVDNMKIVNYKGGDVVFPRQQNCTKLVMIIEGTLKKSRIGNIVATKGLVYGEEHLLENRQQQKLLDDDIILENDGVVAEITHDAFNAIIEGKIEDVMKKNENKYPEIINKHRDQLNNAREEAKDLQLSHLYYLHKLRPGQFGPLYLARHSQDGETFVVKCIEKSLVSDLNVDKFLINCKKALEVVAHPFIVKYYKTFKDDHFIYFLYEYVRGMELYDVIREMGLLNTYEAQFYIASMILVLDHLHSNSVIHRDIKPENIMVDHEGYIVLTDLSTAKIMKGKTTKAFTIIGTPHYMAPEILTGKGYSFSVDLWSLGVCLYEFMCGLVPFGEEAEDPYEIYEDIVRKDIKFPSYLKDRKAKKLIDQLLNRTPEQRLGGSYFALRGHPWFDNFDWEKLYDKAMKAPYSPGSRENTSKKAPGDADLQTAFQNMELLINVIHKELDSERPKEPNDVAWDKEF